MLYAFSIAFKRSHLSISKQVLPYDRYLAKLYLSNIAFAVYGNIYWIMKRAVISSDPCIKPAEDFTFRSVIYRSRISPRVLSGFSAVRLSMYIFRNMGIFMISISFLLSDIPPKADSAAFLSESVMPHTSIC